METRAGTRFGASRGPVLLAFRTCVKAFLHGAGLLLLCRSSASLLWGVTRFAGCERVEGRCLAVSVSSSWMAKLVVLRRANCPLLGFTFLNDASKAVVKSMFAVLSSVQVSLMLLSCCVDTGHGVAVACLILRLTRQLLNVNIAQSFGSCQTVVIPYRCCTRFGRALVWCVVVYRYVAIATDNSPTKVQSSLQISCSTSYFH